MGGSNWLVCQSMTRYSGAPPLFRAEALLLRRRTASLVPGADSRRQASTVCSRREQCRRPANRTGGVRDAEAITGCHASSVQTQEIGPPQYAVCLNARWRQKLLREQAVMMRVKDSRLQGSRGISQLRLSVIQAKELISDAAHITCATSLTLAKSMKS